MYALALRAYPSPSAPVLFTLSAREITGAPAIARVLARAAGDGGLWLRLLDEKWQRGWTPESSVHGARRPGRFGAGGAQVDRPGRAATVDASVLIADARSRQVLYERDPARVHPLVSVMKLFVTALALHRFGPSVSPLLASILAPSDNALAAQLNWRVGGGWAVNRYAAHLGARVHTVGGNGLEPASAASVTQTVRFLFAMRHLPHFLMWEHDLPLADVSGTLAERMQGSAAQGRCYAKTGTLVIPGDVSNLAGYCRARGVARSCSPSSPTARTSMRRAWRRTRSPRTSLPATRPSVAWAMSVST